MVVNCCLGFRWGGWWVCVVYGVGCCMWIAVGYVVSGVVLCGLFTLLFVMLCGLLIVLLGYC